MAISAARRYGISSRRACSVAEFKKGVPVLEAGGMQQAVDNCVLLAIRRAWRGLGQVATVSSPGGTSPVALVQANGFRRPG